MKLRIPALALAGVAIGFVGFSASQAENARSPKAEQKLARALQGRTAGPAINCISNFRGQARMQVVDDDTILFRDSGTVYVQRPNSSCSGIEDGKYSLVTRKYGTQQICSGDINQLVDVSTGFHAGSCTFGPFVPYRKGRS